MFPPVVILAGGFGTRLSEISKHVPKALVEINGKPFIDLKIEQLVNQGVECIYILTGYLGTQLFDYCSQKNYGVPVFFLSDGPENLGTAGALRRAIPGFKGNEFILTYGDNLLSLEISKLIESIPKDGNSLMVTTTVVGVSDKPNVAISEGKVAEYSKKSSSDKLTAIDYGYAVFNSQHFTDTSSENMKDLSEVFEVMSQKGELHCLETDLRYLEIGTPEGLNYTSIETNNAN